MLHFFSTYNFTSELLSFFSLTVTPMRNISEVYLFNQINKIYKLSPLSPIETKGDNLCISLDNCVGKETKYYLPSIR